MDLWQFAEYAHNFKQAINNRDTALAKANDLGATVASYSASQQELSLKKVWGGLSKSLQATLGAMPFGEVNGYNHKTVGEWLDSIELPSQEEA